VVPHIPYSTLLSGRPIFDPVRGRWVPPARFFRNRTVFLDTFYQPGYSTPIGRLTAMELLIAGLDNLLQADPLAPPPPWAQVVVAMLFGGITGRLALGRSPLRGFFRWTAALVVYLILAFGLFVYPGLWLPIVPVIGAGLLAFLLVNQLVFAVDEEELQRQRARHAQRERELAVSREIQASLMPEERVQVGDFVLLSRADPAREVGGDFCGVYPLDSEKRRIGVALGDVAGKGFQGALGMTIATTLLEARASQAASPAEVLRDTNRGLYRRLRRRRMFVTAVYGVLEPETGCWTYASAGQVPPLHLTRDGRASYLPAVGAPLGSLRDSCYTDQRVQLQPGEGVLLASDGFVEARDAQGRPLGYAAFRETVERHMSGTGEELVERLFAATRAATGDQPQDDLTLLLIYRTT
jgi:serine phosphatase RsbU (regulator of sigma subunit)